MFSSWTSEMAKWKNFEHARYFTNWHKLKSTFRGPNSHLSLKKVFWNSHSKTNFDSSAKKIFLSTYSRTVAMQSFHITNLSSKLPNSKICYLWPNFISSKTTFHAILPIPENGQYIPCPTTTIWCDMTNLLLGYKPDNFLPLEHICIHQNWFAPSNQHITQSFKHLMALQTTYPTIH